jgi:hypothetical protein
MSSSASSGTERPPGGKGPEDKTVEMFGWRDAATARRVLDDALARGARR